MTMMSDIPIFYDCEASCIGGLPIEIGWAFIDTSTGEIQSESYLVRPPLDWDMQPVWDPDAEKLHGISLEQLLAHGRLPFEIARRMNDVLAGRELFSDGPADDERWLRIIFEEAGPDPAFTIRRTRADVLVAQLAAKVGWDSASYEAAKAEADCTSPRAHRAEVDARHWAVLWRMISNGSAARR
jgi:hypothetical protein